MTTKTAHGPFLLFETDIYKLNLTCMPRGDKSKYTARQKRQAEHIEKGYEKRGVSKKTAQKRAWATVNKVSGGGKKSGSGRKRKRRG